MKSPDPATLRFDQNGLIVAIAQDAATGTVLMVAFMNREALTRTIETGQAHFWSRDRQRLWRKGESSGNVLHVESIQADCDADALLLSVHASGPACHTGSRSCFAQPAIALDRLADTLRKRNADRPSGSYTASLFERGRPAILRKLGEEAVEVLLAGAQQNNEDLIHEIADLWFHSLLLLEERGLRPGAVLEELATRAIRQAPPGGSA